MAQFATESTEKSTDTADSYPFPAERLPGVRNPLMAELRTSFSSRYEELFGKSSGRGLYSNSDWRRLDYATYLIPEEITSVLDVGVGPGAMLNFLTMCKKYESVVGIDIRKYSRFIEIQEGLDFRLMNVKRLNFEDGSFDVVICMEVLEHLELDDFERAVKELRRVTKKKLIVSVPFEEENPPAYHKQRFTRDNIPEIFPNAEIRLALKPKPGSWPWAFIIENNPSV